MKNEQTQTNNDRLLLNGDKTDGRFRVFLFEEMLHNINMPYTAIMAQSLINERFSADITLKTAAKALNDVYLGIQGNMRYKCKVERLKKGKTYVIVYWITNRK